MDLYINNNFKTIQTPEYQEKLKKANIVAFAANTNIDTRDAQISTDREMVLYYLYSSNLELIDTDKASCLATMSEKEKAFEKLFILVSLRREKGNDRDFDPKYYDSRINYIIKKEILKNKDLTDVEIKEYLENNKELKDYLLSRHIETLEAQSRDNRYFVMYSDPQKKQISPDMNRILKYLMEPTEANKQAIIDMAVKMVRKNKADGNDSVASKMYDEFCEVIENYKDIKTFVIKATASVWAK